ncbi:MULTISPECIES: hypothetical protein [Asticcacaulis]|uniref:hypothetical protein n=1 Tax=Asticcacaulis TaxID=76890 RepID=UPI001AE93071|nr:MULTISPECIES: hypothetical protein [Asticcacaulis]MBP2161833.1 hypothetical protein [Asticcacaulis solisilvae]MDR6802879.1 hypothetical protein [Asticcacaulis sp. BE141]
MSSAIPPVGDIQGTAKVQYVLPPKPVEYVSAAGKSDGGGFGPAVEVTLSKNAQAALKAKMGTTTEFGDGR